MKKIKVYIKKYASIIGAFIVAMVGLLCGAVAPVGITHADEETKVHSAVMDDLQKDSAFNAENYPSVADDYSLDVIQIAESSDGELFIYVYQPSNDTRDLVASSINISQNMEGDNPESYHNYTLTLLSTQGVFDKYRVEGFTLKEDVLRYYSISAIYRVFNEEIDQKPTDDNTIEQVAYPVGQLWTATTYNGAPIYAVRYLELITIETKHIGVIRYKEGGFFIQKNIDSHFVAFSTDRQIDDLLEVEMSYTLQDVSRITTVTLFDTRVSETRGEPVKYDVVLSKDDIVSDDGGWWGDAYEYNRIQRIDDFRTKEGENLSEKSLEALDGKEWVLRFCETDYKYGVLTTSEMSTQYFDEGTDALSVVIFRMEFEYDGQIYNLGVVDNITHGPSVMPDIDTGSNMPNWITNIFGGKGTPTWLKVIIAVIVVIIIAVVGILLLPYIVQGIMWLIPWIIKGLWALVKLAFYIIASPVLLIIYIVRKIRGDYD